MGILDRLASRKNSALTLHGGGKKGGPAAQFQATWAFEAKGAKTKLTLRMVFPSAAARDQVVKQYNGGVDFFPEGMPLPVQLQLQSKRSVDFYDSRKPWIAFRGQRHAKPFAC